MPTAERPTVHLTWNTPTTVVILALVVVLMTTITIRITNTSPRNDFTQDYVSGRAMRDGLNMYPRTRLLVDHYFGSNADFYENVAGQRNPHPPAMIVLLAPLSFLPYSAALMVWKLLIAFGLAFSIYLICRTLGLVRKDSAAIGVCSLILPSIQNEFLYGGTSVVIVFLMTLGFIAYSRGHQRADGIAAGAATAFKLFPALLFLWYLKQRRWKAAGWLAGVAAALSIAALGVIGLHRAADFLDASRVNFQQFRESAINMSLPSLMFRVFSGKAAIVLALIVAAGGLIIAMRSHGSLSGPYWNAAPWMILLSPLSWYATLMVPVVVVATIRLLQRGRLRMWYLLLFALGAFGSVAAIPSGEPGTTNIILDLVPCVAITIYALLDARAVGNATPLPER